jgi:hypothetical protein
METNTPTIGNKVNQMSDHQIQAFTKGRLTNSPSAIRNLLSHPFGLSMTRPGFIRIEGSFDKP